jgi:hypothetical protein
VVRHPDRRSVQLTPEGATELRQHLGVDLDQLGGNLTAPFGSSAQQGQDIRQVGF